MACTFGCAPMGIPGRFCPGRGVGSCQSVWPAPCAFLSYPAQDEHERDRFPPSRDWPIPLPLMAWAGWCPEVVVAGLAIAADRHPSARILLVGDEMKLAGLLARHPRAAAICTIQPAGSAIPMDMKPTAALRLRDSSMRLAMERYRVVRRRALSPQATVARCWRWPRLSLKPFLHKPPGHGCHKPHDTG